MWNLHSYIIFYIVKIINLDILQILILLANLKIMIFLKFYFIIILISIYKDFRIGMGREYHWLQSMMLQKEQTFPR